MSTRCQRALSEQAHSCNTKDAVQMDSRVGTNHCAPFVKATREASANSSHYGLEDRRQASSRRNTRILYGIRIPARGTAVGLSPNRMSLPGRKRHCASQSLRENSNSAQQYMNSTVGAPGLRVAQAAR